MGVIILVMKDWVSEGQGRDWGGGSSLATAGIDCSHRWAQECANDEGVLRPRVP